MNNLTYLHSKYLEIKHGFTYSSDWRIAKGESAWISTWLHIFKWLEDSERWKCLNIPQQIINIVTLMNLLNKELYVVLRFLILLTLIYPYLTNILTSWWGWRHWDLSPRISPRMRIASETNAGLMDVFFSFSLHSIWNIWAFISFLYSFFTWVIKK